MNPLNCSPRGFELLKLKSLAKAVTFPLNTLVPFILSISVLLLSDHAFGSTNPSSEAGIQIHERANRSHENSNVHLVGNNVDLGSRSTSDDQETQSSSVTAKNTSVHPSSSIQGDKTDTSNSVKNTDAIDSTHLREKYQSTENEGNRRNGQSTETHDKTNSYARSRAETRIEMQANRAFNR